MTTGTGASTANPHIAHIDGLRAIAVLAVIAYHLHAPVVPGGLHGVDLFFVISGFVVAASAERWRASSLAAFMGGFYRRRVLRIAPALLACLLATATASMLLVPLAWLSDANDRTGLYAFVGLSNLFLAWHSNGYFAPTAEFNPYVHTWSLGVEEQFYLLFPLLFFAWLRGGRLRWLSTGAFAVVLVASFVDAVLRGRSDATAAFFLTTSRLWEIAAGVLLHQWSTSWQWHGRGSRRLAEAAAWLSLGLLACALWMAPDGVRSILPAVVATAGLLAFLHRRGADSMLARLLACTPLQTIGRRSYSLYLWHWPVFVLLRWTIGFNTPATMLLGVVLTAAFAEMSWRHVEQPLRHSRSLRHAPPWRVVAAGLATLFLAAGVGYGIRKSAPALSLSTVTRHFADWQVHEQHALPEEPGCRLSTRSFDDPWRGEYAASGCRGGERQGHILFVLGDSHAMAYTGVATEYVLRTGANAVVYRNPGCSFGALRPEGVSAACLAQGERVLADIAARARDGDVLLLASLRVARLGDQWMRFDGRIGNDRDDPARREAEADLVRRLAPLAASGVHIVFDAPKPVFQAPAFRCSDRFNAMNPVCAGGLSMSRADVERHRAVALGSLQRLVAALPGADIFDATPLLCDAERCDAVRDGRPLFFDGDHLSGHANALLYPGFARHLQHRAPAPSGLPLPQR